MTKAEVSTSIKPKDPQAPGPGDFFGVQSEGQENSVYT